MKYLDEFAVIIYMGEKRSGKTLTMIHDTYKDCLKNPNIKVYSNLWLNPKYFKNVTYLNAEILTNLFKDKTVFNNCIFLIDEAHIFADARDFQKKGNKALSYFVGQVGKRHNILRMTTHYPELIDLRLRLYLEKLVICKSGIVSKKYIWEQLENYNKILTNEENERLHIKQSILIRKLINYNFEWIEKPDIFIKAKPIFKMYDTNQIILKNNTQEDINLSI